MKNRPKGQHFVNEQYLRLFARRDGKKKPMLWIYERDKTEAFRQDPIAVARRNNYYSVKTPKGEYDDRIELFLGKVESDSLPVIRKLINLEEPNWGDRDRLALFVALQELRVPWARTSFEQLEAKFLDRLVRNAMSVPGVVEDVMAKATRNGDPLPDSVSADDIRKNVLNGGGFTVSCPFGTPA